MVEEDLICAITSEGNGCIDIMKAVRAWVHLRWGDEGMRVAILCNQAKLLYGKEQEIEQEVSSGIRS